MRTVMMIVLGALSAACSHDPIVKTANQAITTTTTTSTRPPAETTNRDVIVSDEIARACNVHFNNVEQAPKFEYEQSVLLPDDQTVLDQVAQCVTTGPLKGQALRLIGRADPRGEVEYNFVLGESRSASVKQFLSSHGVDSSRISTTSRGKLDATGTDEQSWRRDRRVDLELDSKI
jgi:peptidoglycan-associated lipoprotein